MLAYKSGKHISINPEEYKDELKNSKRKLICQIYAPQLFATDALPVHRSVHKTVFP